MRPLAGSPPVRNLAVQPGNPLGPLLDQFTARFAAKGVRFELKGDGSIAVHLPKADPALKKEIRQALRTSPIPQDVPVHFVVDGADDPPGGGGGLGPALGALAQQLSGRFGVLITATGDSSVTVQLPAHDAALEARIKAALPPGVQVRFQVG
jgi:hypothetical protein